MKGFLGSQGDIARKKDGGDGGMEVPVGEDESDREECV